MFSAPFFGHQPSAIPLSTGHIKN
ncbi:protein of unknown function [Cyanobium sp. NIES-981]|nr:protein of unknown function [Cyanobium sp. NIES-981]